MPTKQPYAVKAIVEHHFDVDHLDIYVTFRFPMAIGIKPANDLWIVEVDEVPEDVTASAWQDEFTMLLTVADIPVLPEKVTLEYDGPSVLLKTTWDKQWEPWAAIVSIEIPPVSTTRTFSTGPAQQDDVDVSNVNILFLNCAANAITISGFVGGVNGQILTIAKICTAVNDAKLLHNSGASTQRLLLHAGGDETLTGEYGGWILACNGTNWYDVSHAKHV